MAVEQGSGLMSVDFADKWTPEKANAIVQDAASVGREMGLEVISRKVEADIITKGNNWHEQKYGEAYRDSLNTRGRSDLLPRLDDYAREAETAIETAFRKYTGSDGRRVQGAEGAGPEAGFLSLEPLVNFLFPKVKEREKPAARMVRSAAEIRKQLGLKGLEPRLTDQVAKTIASDVPAEVISRMKPPDQERVMFQIADLIEESPGVLPQIPAMLTKYNLTQAQLAQYLRDAASKAGRTLGSYGWIGKELRKTFKDPEAQKILDSIKDPDNSSWKWAMQKFHWLENVRLASMVSQVKTATRNAYTQAGNYSIKMFEDAVDGALHLPRAKDPQAAFGRLIEDVHALGRMCNRGLEKSMRMKGKEQKALDQLFDIDDLQAARLLTTPMLDVSMASKYAKAITVLNRFQETTIRKLAFDAATRGELRRMGHDPSGMPETWKIPKEDIAKAVEAGAEEALRITWAQTPKKGFAKAVLDTYRAFPLLRLLQPFPRFYFGNALGWLWQHSPGALMTPKVWRATRAGDYRPLVRAGVGMMTLAWATSYRARDDSPGAWYKIKIGGKEIDTRPFAPMIAPYLLAGELILDQMRESRGEIPRLGMQDIAKGLVGLNRVAGTGLAVVDAVFDNRGTWEWRWKQMKEVAGSYVGSFLVPLLQVRDVIAHWDPEERLYRDTSGAPFTGQIQRNIPLLDKSLPPMPATTRPGYVESESPLMSQITGILPKQSTHVETELSKLGISWRDIVPPADGPPEVTRKSKAYLGNMIEKPMSALFQSKAYRNVDDAQRQEMVMKVLGALRSAAARRAEAESGIRKTLRIERNRGAPRFVPLGTPPPLPRRIRPVTPPPVPGIR